MLKFNSIKTRLTFYLLIGFIPIFAALLLMGENYAKDTLYKNAILKAKMLALEAARNIEDLTFSISTKPKEIAKLVGGRLSSLNKVEKLMAEDVKHSKFIYGMALALFPEYSPSKSYFCPYYYKKGNILFKKQLIPPSYNYLVWDWFKKPIRLKKNIWSEPYFDKGGGEVWMSTYSAIIKNSQGKIVGIATADVSIEFLSKIVNKIRILKTGGAFLFTRSGEVLAPLGNKAVMQKGVSEILNVYNRQDFKDLVHRIFKEKNNYSQINIKGEKYLVYYTPIRDTDWIIGVTFPKNELFLPIKRMEGYFFAIVLAGFIVLITLIVFVSKKVTDDITKIKNISMEIAKGNFDVAIPNDLSDESRNVAEAIDVMQKSLKKFMKAIKEKVRMENELELARKIQSSFIPNRLSKQINGIKFDAFSEWARQVGGDFYGINEIDDKRVLFYLGDVSGKGISAVLYAVIVKSMIDVLAKQTISVGEIAMFLNNHLSNIAKHNTFATMFIGLIDKDSNQMHFCNAGHNPSFIFKDNAIFTPLLSGNVPIGTFAGFDYKTKVLDLDTFDGLLIFSDGITDALNINGKQFGEERLFNTIKENLCSKDNIVNSLEKELYNFIGEEDIYDDTTLLSIVKTS